MGQRTDALWSCGDLPQTVQTGQPAFDRRFGQPCFDYLSSRPDAARVWDDGMARFSAMENAPFAAAYTFPTGALIDVGGGQGGFLAGRWQAVSGTFFDAVPAGGDVYVSKRVLHDWDDATCVGAAQAVRDVISTEGRLLVIDAVIPAGDDPHPAKIVDLVM